jgi:sugar-specific transcriptional regulator TrmB
MKHPVHFPILQEIGLNQAETLVFEVLLEGGPQIGSTIAQKTGLGRGNAYNALQTLQEKGLVHEEKGKKITSFSASDPERLRALLDQKKASVEALQGQFEAVVPQFKSFFRLFTKQPTIRVFEGVEGLKDMYREMLKAGHDIYAIVSADEPDPALYRWLRTVYKDKRIAAGIRVKGVASSTSRGQELLEHAESELREVRGLDPRAYPLRGEVNVFGECVAFISYRTDELFGLIVESPSLAMTFRSTVQALFDAAEDSQAARETDGAGGASNTATREPG